jgi:hypothetical protein
MAGVGAATAAHERQVRELRTEGILSRGELEGVALVQLGGGIEFLMTAGRRVDAKPDDP